MPETHRHYGRAWLPAVICVLAIMLICLSATWAADGAASDMPAGHIHPPADPASGSFFSDLLKTYTPRRVCMFYEDSVIWMHVIADAMTAIAYYSIPFAIAYFVWRRKDLAFSGVFWMFVAFILACGTTHLFGVIDVWRPFYRVDGLIKLVTGVLSIGTAIALWPLIPKALALPSPAQLERTVQQRTEELARTNQTLREEIAARAKVEEELRALQADLERRVEQRTAELAAANRELEAFGYSVSHDLRAPLRHIIGFVDLMEEHSAANLDDKGRRYLKVISDAGERMGHLIDDLLHLSRVGRAALAETDVDLGDLVKEAVQELAGEAKDRPIDWRIGPMPVVRGDRNLLRNVMVNLIGNALKYSRGRDPAIIEVGSREEQDRIVCFVRDNGAGFDMQHVGKLFGVFQRLHRAEDFEGTGIGLASVRRIIERHGGKAWAEGAVGQGATIFFSLPAKQVVRSNA